MFFYLPSPPSPPRVIFIFSGGENINPAFASVLACVAEDNQVSITAQAHGVLASGALSGYSVGPTQRNAKNEPSTSSDEDTDDEGTDFFKAEFVDDSLLSAVTEGRWFGAATMEELPGGGLHRHVPSAEMILYVYHFDFLDNR